MIQKNLKLYSNSLLKHKHLQAYAILVEKIVFMKSIACIKISQPKLKIFGC